MRVDRRLLLRLPDTICFNYTFTKCKHLKMLSSLRLCSLKEWSGPGVHATVWCGPCGAPCSYSSQPYKDFTNNWSQDLNLTFLWWVFFFHEFLWSLKKFGYVQFQQNVMLALINSSNIFPLYSLICTRATKPKPLLSEFPVEQWWSESSPASFTAVGVALSPACIQGC